MNLALATPPTAAGSTHAFGITTTASATLSLLAAGAGYLATRYPKTGARPHPPLD